MKKKVIAIIGPTAVGKTKASIEIALALDGEIISGDSMQIYRGMNIGTAKVTEDEMQGIPHHLIDIKDPWEEFSAAEFKELATHCIEEITNRGKVPIIVGGTGLYIQAVLSGYHFSKAASNQEYRVFLEKRIEEEGIEKVYNELLTIDPESIKRIHPNNVRRVIRALEIYHETGLTMTEYLKKQEQEAPYDDLIIGLTMERDLLYDRINKRVDQMVQQGLIEEVRALYEAGIRDCQSVQAIGYKELYDYFEGKVSKEEAIELLKRNSRRYAKRQLTWFRNKMDVNWVDMSLAVQNETIFAEKIQEILNLIAGKLHLKAK
ncbi:tRNA (adenosine(37)-N6)-dimethylallyltransferase MiaA [Calidifontibacillus erzurumensis]|uniref:tRNA dimethylallyltransferase n=1 Tax=Calidifontibacillus erzurumensis TaxID=2741433 RepID=A0A8J8GCX7_9BACI|nr:tRNA (adenosine(37)-N6)-dimethylallyltransferase MiaA [Calidifontibacillus erzurumensis]NSL51102.1 tRNA (adenosine(37)-N6)-dimethylallyltransferase MiaA [Calidifontibacillus erzurumensis]